jgi:hypothetical protein
MKTAFENRFVKILTDSEKSYSEMIFFPASEEMSEEDYKLFYTEFLNIQHGGGKFNFLRHFVDMRDFAFTISPDLQTWIATSTKEKTDGENKAKYAILMSNDYLSHLSLEQSFEEIRDAGNTDFITCYFATAENAKDWLFSEN